MVKTFSLFQSNGLFCPIRKAVILHNKKSQKYYATATTSKVLEKKESFQKKPFIKESFQKDSFQKEPFQKKPFQRKPFQKEPFQKKPFIKKPFIKKPFIEKKKQPVQLTEEELLEKLKVRQELLLERKKWFPFKDSLLFLRTKRKINGIKRIILSYFSKRSFFWAISFFSKLHFILWKIRFVNWMNFFSLSFNIKDTSFFFRLPLFSSASYIDTMPTVFSDTVYTRISFFNKSSVLWHSIYLGWSSIEFSSKWIFLRDFITRYQDSILKPTLKPSFIFNKWLPFVYAEKRKIRRWFFANKLPKRLRTPLTDAQWAKSVARNDMVKEDIYFFKRSARIYPYHLYPNNIVRKIF